jgi:hypothetical protein
LAFGWLKDNMADELPEMTSVADFRRVLQAELGYCTCAFAGAIPLLRDVLLLAKRRTASTGDFDEFKRISHELDAALRIDTASGLASWFVYSLDRAGLVTHNYNVTDLWITPKGEAVLDALERYPDPASIEESDDGGILIE